MLKNEFLARLTMIDMNQTSFAEKIGVTRECVNRWLNVTTIPKLALIALYYFESEYKK